MMHNPMTIDWEASAVFAGTVEDALGSAAGTTRLLRGSRGCARRTLKSGTVATPRRHSRRVYYLLASVRCHREAALN